MPTAARMAEYGVLKLILLKPAKSIDGAISLIATMHSIVSGRQKKDKWFTVNEDLKSGVLILIS